MFTYIIKKTFSRISNFIISPDDSEEIRIKKSISIGIILAAICCYLGYGLLFIYFNEQLSGIVALSTAVFLILLIYSVKVIHVKYDVWISYIASPTIILSMSAIHILLGGFVQSGMILLYLLVIPIAVATGSKTSQAPIWFTTITVIFFSLGFLQPYYLRETNNIPAKITTAAYSINSFGVGAFMVFSVYHYLQRSEALSKMLQIEQAKSDALLLNILPEEIATSLKNGKRVIADEYNSVSVLFADIVNFTPLSATMTPSELVELLNEVFSGFDKLVETYGLEKIKTIGDCYMAAAGVPGQRDNHAEILTRFALDIQAFVKNNLFRGKQLQFRIGVSSGPVVAGVIGHKKFSYDLWGDTVNTASRMESHGLIGNIQITESTYDLIKDHFICESRGIVNVKGKGETKIWHVLSANA